uniref:SHSP domain-containing protein n=1 Tax=Scylla olivacea TaxID=85551 RepID=A0A0P4W2A2_SCYOL
MVSFRMVGRAAPRVRAAVTQASSRRALVLPMVHPSQVRLIHRGPFWREPFSQMEEFMRDMERKFKRDIEDTLGTFAKNFPGTQLPMSSVMARAVHPTFGQMENVSTPEKYKLNFYFMSAKPEDIKVTLKGRSLKISGEVVMETENSKSSQQMSVELLLPEDVEAEGLESSLSQEGVLVVEAPRNPAASPEAPKAIPIERE